jgi:hypothetical protein
MKAFAVLLLAAVAVTFAGSARAAGPGHAPSRLWYRLLLLVDDAETLDNGGSHTVKALWRIESNTAVIVTAQCRTSRRIVEGTCRDAFHGRPPTGAVDDIEFDAGGMAVLDKYTWTDVHPPTQANDGTRCPGYTFTMTSYGGTFTGIMGGSLGESGLKLMIGRPLGGSMTMNLPGEVCTSPTLGSYTRQQAVSTSYLLKDYLADHPSLSQMAVQVAGTLRVRAGMFGHGFTLSAADSETLGPRTSSAKVKLVFTLCPRGGRGVRGC